MKKVTKMTSLVIVMMITLMVLTGCANVNMKVKLNEDGSADISYVMGYNKEFLTSMNVKVEDLENEESFTETMEAARDDGYTVTKYEDDSVFGFQAVKHVNHVKEFSVQDATGEATEVENDSIQYEKSFLKTVYSQDSKMDLTNMNTYEEDAQTSAMINMMMKQMKITYQITLPFKVGDHNATTVSEDGKTLTWEIKAGEINEIKFIAMQDYTMFLMAGIIILVVIIVVAIILIIMKKRKKVTPQEK